MTIRERARCRNEHPVVDTISAHDSGCIGCRTWDKPIMVTLGTSEDGDIQHHDFFLTEAQAKRLYQRVIAALFQNSVAKAKTNENKT
jgi:hypothetical protein